ncbi:hypothetical protein HW115_18730 [Verrucomicrobiaceae bacterium N1E253]|uniref:Uncharacterized protein n=1 Tax=Oceaniferula marina TaxID=2748318 RepID=A0A851GSA4_9BACT|nr:hypothetical protein [Oceaniferula marina]NWK57660.1 hypothetical protein [Oceaniferula marina]
MTISHGKVSLFVLLLNIVVGVPCFLMAFLPERAVYNVTSWPIDNEVNERIADLELNNLSFPNEVNRVFQRSRRANEAGFIKDICAIKGAEELLQDSEPDFSILFRCVNENGRISISSSSTNPYSAEKLHSIIFSEMDSTYSVGVDSEVEEKVNHWYRMGMKLFPIYVWGMIPASMGYWLFVAFGLPFIKK